MDMPSRRDQVAVMPQRIQLRRVKGWRMPPNTVVVSRPSKWGNPWTVEECGSAEEAVRMFRARLPGAPLFEPAPHPESYMGRIIARLPELRGKNLACWCPLVDREGRPVPCHADILLELANRD